jgi:ComF family protein
MKARSYAHYEGSIARALLMLKYRPSRSLADVMGGWLAVLVESQGWEISTIVPVPLGVERMKQRGYNQAALLGGALAKRLGVPIENELLERHRETRSQVGLDPHARHENVHGAFHAVREIRLDERCLLVDDLFTTGATLAACAYALLEAGSRNLYAVTVARATGRK